MRKCCICINLNSLTSAVAQCAITSFKLCLQTKIGPNTLKLVLTTTSEQQPPMITPNHAQPRLALKLPLDKNHLLTMTTGPLNVVQNDLKPIFNNHLGQQNHTKMC